MRVLMTTDAAGGVWSYSVELLRQLDALGCEVVVACLGGPLSDSQRAEAQRLRNVEVHESSYRLEWMEEPWDDVRRGNEWIAGLQRATRCELLHCNSYGPATARWDIPVLLVAHSCVYSWWRAVHGANPGPQWSRYRRCVTAAIRGADVIVAPTHAMLEGFRRAYPEAAFGDRGVVIYNGVDTGRWPAGTPSEPPFVFAAGRVWDDAKNLRQLERIAPEIGCRVVIAGDHGEDTPGTQSSATLLGRLSRRETAAHYRRAAIFAHPARYEPFGLAVLEAALSRCPLVLGDIGSLRELWDGAAVFVDPGDPAALRDTLRRLLDDRNAQRSLGHAARSRALRYGARAMAGSYLDCYRMLQRERSVAEGVA